MAGRFNSTNDLRTFETFNKELVGDLRLSKDGIINQSIKLFKVSAEHTSTNLYGESTGGKIYKPGVQFACLIESEDIFLEQTFNQLKVDVNHLKDVVTSILNIEENNLGKTINKETKKPLCLYIYIRNDVKKRKCLIKKIFFLYFLLFLSLSFVYY